MASQEITASGCGLGHLLRARTRDLHRLAERSGVMASLMRGQIERTVYCRLLRNLHALYAALESALLAHRTDACIRPWLQPALLRGPALAADLDFLHGRNWENLPVATSMRELVARFDGPVRAAPCRLVAHAYVRYLGDLSGGQILHRIVATSLGLDGEGTRFYRFDGADVRLLAACFRDALDSLPLTAGDGDAVIDEAREAFTLHIRLFQELDREALHHDHAGA